MKAIAASTDLPEEIRAGVAKPDLSDEERAALHNVTSGLYKRDPVRQSVNRAIESVCEALNVAPPGKGKPAKKGKRDDKEDAPETKEEVEKKAKKVAKVEEEPMELDEESEFEGFGTDVDEPGPSIPEPDSEAEGVEEKEFAKYAHLLGSSSDEDSDEEDEERFERFKGREKVNLDDISLSGGSAPGSVADSESDSASDSEPEAKPRKQPSVSLSPSPSPPPAKKKKKKASKATTPSRPVDSTFLPTLMGGYISGSESDASSLDMAPAKKRLGQKQRQAIWEKKFGGKAKHLQNPQPGKRDSGWDMKRGAVGADDQGGRTPWKQGVRNPLMNGGGEVSRPQKPQVERKKDDVGSLHPSWEAMKKAKESQKAATFAGAKITFD